MRVREPCPARALGNASAQSAPPYQRPCRAQPVIARHPGWRFACPGLVSLALSAHNQCDNVKRKCSRSKKRSLAAFGTIPLGMIPEHERLKAQRMHVQNWRRWEPCLSERQWGTVREDYSANGDAWNYLSHEEARSRAFRWGEDGIAGSCSKARDSDRSGRAKQPIPNAGEASRSSWRFSRGPIPGCAFPRA